MNYTEMSVLLNQRSLQFYGINIEANKIRFLPVPSTNISQIKCMQLSLLVLSEELIFIFSG